MNLLTTAVPAWVSIAFILTFPIAVFMIARTAKLTDMSVGFDGEKTRKTILFAGLGYLFVVAIVAMTGFFTVNTLPPRILLTTALPLWLWLIFHFVGLLPLHPRRLFFYIL